MFLLLGLLINCSISYGANLNSATHSKIKLTVFFKEAKPGDTLLLYVSPRYFNSLGSIKPQAQTANSQGAFVFEVSIEFPVGFWQLRKLEYSAASNVKSLPQLAEKYFWEAGDDVVLNVSYTPSAAGLKSICKFKGKGAAKYNLLYRADSIMNKSVAFVNANHDPYDELSGKNIHLMRLVAKYIDNDKNQISDLARYITKTELFMSGGLGLGIHLERYAKNQKMALGSTERIQLLNIVRDIFAVRGVIPIDSTKIYFSGSAISYIWYGIQLESFLKFDKTNTQWIYDQIKERYTGNLREQIIAYWLQYKRIDGELANPIYQDALVKTKSIDAIAQLKSVEHFYAKKQFANYSLPNAEDKIISFSQFKGKVTFIDFWFTGCAACASLFKNVVSKVEEHYAKDSLVVFVTVSADKYKDKWLSGLKTGLYTSDLATNLYTGGDGFMHPIIRDYKLSYMPVAMLVDAKGIIRYFNTDNLYKESELIKAIEELKKE